jgi:hypothetical protein
MKIESTGPKRSALPLDVRHQLCRHRVRLEVWAVPLVRTLPLEL